MPNFDTLEAAQAEILRLQQENASLTTERDTNAQEVERLRTEVSQVRTHNQNLFNQLNAQYSGKEGEKDEETEEAPTCEEFAKTLDI